MFPMLVPGASLPATGRTFRSDVVLTYMRWLAMYASCVPSGDIATDGKNTSEKACPSGSEYENRVTAAGVAAGRRVHTAATTMAADAITARSGIHWRGRCLEGASGRATASAWSLSANKTPDTSLIRVARFFCRHRSIASRASGGTDAGSFVQSGSLFRTLAACPRHRRPRTRRCR